VPRSFSKTSRRPRRSRPPAAAPDPRGRG
jgi:hypothetical protein